MKLKDLNWVRAVILVLTLAIAFTWTSLAVSATPTRTYVCLNWQTILIAGKWYRICRAWG